MRRRRRRGRGRNSRSDRRSLWLVKENEPAGQVLLARIHEGKERTSFFRVSFLSIRRDEGHRIRASALSHTSRRSPRAWTVGKLHGAHRFRICRGLGLLFILLLFFSPSLSLFFLPLLFHRWARRVPVDEESNIDDYLWDRPAIACLLSTSGIVCAFPVMLVKGWSAYGSNSTWVFLTCYANEKRAGIYLRSNFGIVRWLGT